MGEILLQEQLEIPGIAPKEKAPHYIPTTAGKRPISGRRRMFAWYYAGSHKKAESAIKAGYSQKSAGQIANQLLQKNEVLEAVTIFEEEILRELGINRIDVLKSIAYLANSDIRRVLDQDGRLINPKAWDESTALAVSSIEFGELGEVKRLRLWDKPSNLERLAKYLKLWIDKMEVEDVTVGNLEERLKLAKKKAHGTAD